MNRRAFLKGSLAASAVAGVAGTAVPSLAAGMNEAARDYYEWRMYRLKAGADHALLDGYLEKALIPALNRLGSKPVGVFTEMPQAARANQNQPIEPLEEPVFVLIPHPSINAFLQTTAKLATDAGHLKAGADYLQVAKKNPAFVRIDSWLLHAFAGMPHLEQPAYSKERKPRIFEARTYESHSEIKAQKKVDMFNAGEIEVMRDVGLGPIFFGQALIGSNLPHLIYMLSGENRDLHKQHFGAFGKDPRWKKLSADPQYADTVSKITSRFMEPTSYSQI